MRPRLRGLAARSAVLGGFVLGVAALGACATGSHTVETPMDSAPLVGFEFLGLDGALHTLQEKKGQVVLVDFWATWCVPCRDSLPKYNAWHKELEDKGFEVVAISVDTADADIAAFMRTHAPDVTVYWDKDGQGAALLNIPTMPTAFLLDRDGKIVLRHAGFRAGDGARLKARIDELLSK